MIDETKPILIFDGVCNMCNASVNFVMKRDKEGKVMFTANQHGPGQEILKKFNKPVDDVDTFYLLENGKIYDRSSAVLRVSKYMNFPWNLGVIFLIVPKFIRDFVYKFVAKNRYKWFGKKDTCRLPTPEERARFLT